MDEPRRFPCAVGDVLVRPDHDDEAWLAGAILLREGPLPTRCLFVAPDAEGDRAVYARAYPDEDLVWLEPVAIEVGSDPPSAIEIAGARFERVRRLPLRAKVIGEGAPDLGATLIVGEYRGRSDEVALVLAGPRAVRVWRGVHVPKGEYEVWQGDKD